MTELLIKLRFVRKKNLVNAPRSRGEKDREDYADLKQWKFVVIVSMVEGLGSVLKNMLV